MYVRKPVLRVGVRGRDDANIRPRPEAGGLLKNLEKQQFFIGFFDFWGSQKIEVFG